MSDRTKARARMKRRIYAALAKVLDSQGQDVVEDGEVVDLPDDEMDHLVDVVVRELRRRSEPRPTVRELRRRTGA